MIKRNFLFSFFFGVLKLGIGNCESWQWQCKDGTCIDHIARCNFKKDCPDNSDEIDCKRCESDEFRCNDGTCLSIDKTCDGQPDCPHSEDEESCG